jgi:3-phenylpropionate/trans-cinnamate dioxygenase ferredoxin reductase subunit
MEERTHRRHDNPAIGATLPPPLVTARPAHSTERKTIILPEPPRAMRVVLPVMLPSRAPRLADARSPSTARVQGRVVQLRDLAQGIVEVTITPDTPIRVRPGQFCQFSFAGFPGRKFSPTANLGAIRADSYIRLHIRRVRGGHVTSQLGKAIKAGHPVEIEGPFGRGFRQAPSLARLVLIGGGTGFAPIWAIAAAALREAPSRSLVLAGAARTLDTFYMASALEIASRYPNVSILAAVEGIAGSWRGFVPGLPVDHLPPLTSDDIVYAAGSHALVGSASKAAAAAAAAFHADPLEPATPPNGSWLDSARRWLTSA